jgi:hypothetical protein
MTKIKLYLQADNFTEATVEGSEDDLRIKIDPDFQWNAEGLLQLSALFKGAALLLTANI